MTELLRTPLFPVYSSFPGARCIDFGGWELPVQFSGILKEHEAVRTKAGLFDVSHMGEFLVSGPGAESFLQRMLTNDVSRLSVGAAQYTIMCYENGGTVDDLLVYKLADEQFMLVVNASNIDKDFNWLQEHLEDGITLVNVSEKTALLALQGPLAAEILAGLTDAPLASLPSFHFLQNVSLSGVTALLSRTGYTGEDGFEIYCSAKDAVTVWNGLMAAGEPLGLQPIGLGARDTLRFEARLPLYGQELSASISPLEAGLGFFVKLDKGDFVGREALAKQKEDGMRRRTVGLEIAERGIPRSHYPVFADAGAAAEPIGEITTGMQSPTSKRNLGLALIDSAFAAQDAKLWVEIRGKKFEAAVVKTPFYKRGDIN
ncbi:glycine cleavage system aminomethyltransferase GcvT [Paenibacillus sp. HB172176]|uniref:glycine cleavage system aminomethyltransferase GcvT n=1 Tax=Paenibacillus sp. HB172176 TaxID=2493690 RepID=UPI00143C8FE4|nr:glycine cleavage system aminomethyltransferase GcvT [Paenibacillus sp. HB172176]